MFGQYSPYSKPRLTKRDMVANAEARAGGMKVATARKVANNTLVYRFEGEPETVERWSLWDTEIVTKGADGFVRIDTGGWNSVTTRDRFRMAGIRVYTSRGVPYVNGRPFDRVATIAPDGSVSRTDFDADDVKQRQAAIDAYMAEWKRKGLPRDGWGDPWVTPEMVDAEMMRGWVSDQYVFRNLYAFALLHAGFKPAGVGFRLADVDRSGGKLDATDLRRIRRYVRMKFGMGG